MVNCQADTLINKLPRHVLINEVGYIDMLFFTQGLNLALKFIEVKVGVKM